MNVLLSLPTRYDVTGRTDAVDRPASHYLADPFVYGPRHVWKMAIPIYTVVDRS